MAKKLCVAMCGWIVIYNNVHNYNFMYLMNEINTLFAMSRNRSNRISDTVPNINLKYRFRKSAIMAKRPITTASISQGERRVRVFKALG